MKKPAPPKPMAKTSPKTASTPAAKPAAKSMNRSTAICGPSGYESVSIRPIDNGFIVSRSTDKGYSEVYSATKPKLEMPPMKGAARK